MHHKLTTDRSVHITVKGTWSHALTFSCTSSCILILCQHIAYDGEK